MQADSKALMYVIKKSLAGVNEIGFKFFNKLREMNYELSCIATIKLWLRRTLVRFIRY